MRTLTLFLALILAASCADSQQIFTRKRVKADTLNYGGSLPIGVVRDTLRAAKDGVIAGVNVSTTSQTPAWISQSAKNTNRSTGAQATDTAAHSFGFTASGQPFAKIVNATGATKFSVDSLGMKAVFLSLHTIALGDSVFGHMILDVADTTLKFWNGSAWVTIQDLAP